MNLEIINCLQQLTENVSNLHKRVMELEAFTNEDIPHDFEKIQSTLKGLELTIKNSVYDQN